MELDIEISNDYTPSEPIQMIEENKYEEFEQSSRQYHIYMNRGSRREMLDRYSTGNNIYGIYDGHGSSHISEYLSENLPTRLTPKLDNEECVRIFQEIDNELTQFTDSGSAALILAIDQLTVTVASLGDSKALVIREQSHQEISVTHSPSVQSERTRIEKQGGWVLTKGNVSRVQGRLAVSRSFGDYSLKKYIISTPEITQYQIQNSDKYIVMASDGFWDELNAKQVVDYLNNTKNSTNLAKGLYELIKEQTDYIKDNVTVIVIPL